MARYRLRQKILALGSDFTIQDDRGVDVYKVDGKVLSIGDKLSFQDMDGGELLHIRQKVLRFRPTYEIQRRGTTVATVRKELLTFMKDRFEVDLPGPNDLKAQGDILDLEYEFTRDDETVARVSKTWFSLRDTYGVDIREGEDDPLILAATVVIDLVSHQPDD